MIRIFGTFNCSSVEEGDWFLDARERILLQSSVQIFFLQAIIDLIDSITVF